MLDEKENAMENIEDDTVVVIDTDDEIEMLDDVEEPTGDGKGETGLSAKKLYDIILRHPDWRVVEVSEMGSDYCHPLKYWFSTTGLLFQYDGAARQMHHEAECEDIIDLNGAEPLSEERAEEGVYIMQDFTPTEWEWSEAVVEVRKATLDAGAKWIKLHPAK